jgi:hypothetical protein
LASPSEARPYAGIILQVSRETGVDPFVLALIGQRESNWGLTLNPPGPGGTGDNGAGHGLMQIDSGSWSDWLAANNWRDALTNVRKGAAIYKSYRDYFASTPKTPTVTVSATNAARWGVPAGQRRDPRPLTGDALLSASLAAYNAGPGTVLQAVSAGLHPDQVTSPRAGNIRDYSAWVMVRMQQAIAKFV